MRMLGVESGPDGVRVHSQTHYGTVVVRFDTSDGVVRPDPDGAVERMAVQRELLGLSSGPKGQPRPGAPG